MSNLDIWGDIGAGCEDGKSKVGSGKLSIDDEVQGTRYGAASESGKLEKVQSTKYQVLGHSLFIILLAVVSVPTEHNVLA